MLELLALAAAAAGGTYAYLLRNRAAAHTRWKVILTEVAGKLGGRASPATMFDAPELRAEVSGMTVTVKLREIHKPERGVAIAEVKPRGVPEDLRVYLGWDVVAPPEGLEHLPAVDAAVSAFAEGTVTLRGDPRAARSLAERAALDLVDLRRESGSRAMEVVCRGGYVELRAHGMTESPHMVERLVLVAARIATAISGVAAPSAPSGAGAAERPAVPGDRPAAAAASAGGPTAGHRCALCGGALGAERGVGCARCGAPHHRGCWHQATGCATEGCGETRSVPLEGA